MFGTVEAFRARAGWRASDPQLGRELDLAADRDAFLAQFERGVTVTRRIGVEDDAPERPPWWRRLLGGGGRR